MRRRIAVVDDDADSRLLVQVMLEDAYVLDVYETGSAALAGMVAAPPDLVLLDLSLPDLEGTEVLRRIRGNAVLHGLRVVALTAQSIRGDRERYLGMGFNGYLTKPITGDGQLLPVIERLLAGRAA
jgi:CheY-like chemotaxis protein